MRIMAEAIERAGLVSKKDIQAIEREKRLWAEEADVRCALRRAQRTGKSVDWLRYAAMNGACRRSSSS